MKKESWIMLLAFFAGIVSANLFGMENLTSYGILNTYFFDNFSKVTIHYRELAAQILFLRAKELMILVLISFFLKKVSVWKACMVFLMYAFGFFMTAALFNFGFRGILAAAAALTPQWFFYAAGLFFLECGRKRRKETEGSIYDYRNGRKKYETVTVYALLVLLTVLAGILTESYVNPPVLKCIQKII